MAYDGWQCEYTQGDHTVNYFMAIHRHTAGMVSVNKV